MHCRLRLDPSTWRSKPGTRFCCLSSLFWNGFKVMTWCKLDTVSFRLSIPGYLEASLPATEKAAQVKNIVICGLTFLATCLTTSTPSLPLISNSLDILPWSTWERLAAIARWANSCRKGISKDKTRSPQMSFWIFLVQDIVKEKEDQRALNRIAQLHFLGSRRFVRMDVLSATLGPLWNWFFFGLKCMFDLALRHDMYRDKCDFLNNFIECIL